jgi:hypothetical protein
MKASPFRRRYVDVKCPGARCGRTVHRLLVIAGRSEHALTYYSETADITVVLGGSTTHDPASRPAIKRQLLDGLSRPRMAYVCRCDLAFAIGLSPLADQALRALRARWDERVPSFVLIPDVQINSATRAQRGSGRSATSNRSG